MAVGSHSFDYLGPGEAWIFDRDAESGDWIPTRLVASDRYVGQRFGAAVALEGDRVVVNAPGDDEAGDNAGALYIFERSTRGEWIETASCSCRSARKRSSWPSRTSRSAGTALSPSMLAHGDPLPLRGAVHIREHAAKAGWVLRRQLFDPEAASGFGQSVVLDGSRLVVGAGGADDERGAMYRYDLYASARICSESPRHVAFDCDGDGAFDISDVIRELDYLFLFGRPAACEEAMGLQRRRPARH